MIATTVKLISGIAFVVAVSACATSGMSDGESLAQAGAMRLDASQIKTHLSGKTEVWFHGGAYYQADGKIKVKWRKTISKGSWDVSADGNLCFELPNWKKTCQFYMKKDDVVYMLNEDKSIGSTQVYDGDKLGSIGSYNSGADRR